MSCGVQGRRTSGARKMIANLDEDLEHKSGRTRALVWSPFRGDGPCAVIAEMLSEHPRLLPTCMHMTGYTRGLPVSYGYAPIACTLYPIYTVL